MHFASDNGAGVAPQILEHIEVGAVTEIVFRVYLQPVDGLRSAQKVAVMLTAQTNSVTKGWKGQMLDWPGHDASSRWRGDYLPSSLPPAATQVPAGTFFQSFGLLSFFDSPAQA